MIMYVYLIMYMILIKVSTSDELMLTGGLEIRYNMVHPPHGKFRSRLPSGYLTVRHGKSP